MGGLELKVDRSFDDIELDDEELEVNVEADDVEAGRIKVLALSSKRKDVVRQNLAFLKSDSQQFVRVKRYDARAYLMFSSGP